MDRLLAGDEPLLAIVSTVLFSNPGSSLAIRSRGLTFLRKPSHQISGRMYSDSQQTGAPTDPIWLAAPKTTDALYLVPSSNPHGLAMHRLPARTELPAPDQERWLGIRAAALSAVYILVNRASLELDIDPEEFDVLEPRLYGRDIQLPLLQITDHLVNGAGFCKRLSSADLGNRPWIADLVRSVLEDSAAYPREKFEDSSHASCDSACYKCLLRYGNQPFHGLLDWQLGMVFLRALVDSSFRCGLDCRRWTSRRLAQTTCARSLHIRSAPGSVHRRSTSPRPSEWPRAASRRRRAASRRRGAPV